MSARSGRVKGGGGMHEIAYFEIAGPDVEKLASFYSRVFGWTPAPGPFPAYLSLAEGAGAGLPGGFRQDAPDRVLYIRVPDLQAALDAAVREGARVLIPPTRVPGVVHFALFEDPAGNRTGLVQ